MCRKAATRSAGYKYHNLPLLFSDLLATSNKILHSSLQLLLFRRHNQQRFYLLPAGDPSAKLTLLLPQPQNPPPECALAGVV